MKVSSLQGALILVRTIRGNPLGPHACVQTLSVVGGVFPDMFLFGNAVGEARTDIFLSRKLVGTSRPDKFSDRTDRIGAEKVVGGHLPDINASEKLVGPLHADWLVLRKVVGADRPDMVSMRGSCHESFRVRSANSQVDRFPRTCSAQ